MLQTSLENMYWCHYVRNYTSIHKNQTSKYEFNPNQQKEDTQKVSIISTDSRQFQEKLRLNVLLKGISSHNDNMLSLPFTQG